MIRVGVGGWTFEPWRGVFFPDGLKHARELEYASRQLTAIEINGTYYRTQTPATFAKWAAETPDDFVFTCKALRFTTNRRVLAEAGESVGKFLGSGMTELGPKLGPILWQFAATKKFEPDDFAAFLDLLPGDVGGVRLRHALEVRHDSFRDPAFVELARSRKGAAIVFADSDDYPGDRRPHGRLRLRAAAGLPGRGAHRVHGPGARPLGRGRQGVGAGRGAARPRVRQ